MLSSGSGFSSFVKFSNLNVLSMDAWSVIVFGLITEASTVLGAEWQTTPDPVLYACQGKTVQLPWKLDADPRSELVEVVHWFFQGPFTSDLIATHTHGQFLPSVKYTGRVSELQDRGIALRGVTPDDAGSYRVEALVRQSNTSLVSHLYSQSVYLQVSDAPMVENGRLAVTQDPQASWDVTSEGWTIRLLCGVFTFKGHPPVRVEWILPSGTVRQSSGYAGGRFYLSLAAPVLPEGNYTCRVPQQFYPDLCFTGQRADKLLGAGVVEASIAVDEVRARLTLAEAEQGRLRLDNERLEATVANLTDSLSGLRSDFMKMQQSLTDEIQALWNATMQKGPQDVCSGINYQVINDATGVRDLSNSSYGELCDNKLTAGWYRLFLKGHDATIPTSCTPYNKCGTTATMWMDLNGQSLPAVGQEIQGRACSSFNSKCCWMTRPSVTVRNCGNYFIYHLGPAPNCFHAFCLQKKI